jgi:hypothetical protein
MSAEQNGLSLLIIAVPVTTGTKTCILCSSSYFGSRIAGLWIRIGSGARKLRNFSGKMHCLVIFFFNLPLKRYKITLLIEKM